MLFILWKAVYLFILSPKRILDDPLTQSVGVATTGMLNILPNTGHFTVQKLRDSMAVEGGMVSGNVMDIYRGEEKTLRIADACNGLELMVLYAGFILCFPAPLKRKFIFAAIGISLIYLLNIIRCTLLVLIFIHYKAYLDFSHHFVFTFIVYAFIFLLWYIFTKNQRLNVLRPS
ncbi:archaeosortase/exosortase family protein [Flavitalea flava]